MIWSTDRRNLESSLSALLVPGTEIKSSTLLQAYITFSLINQYTTVVKTDFRTAYIKVRKDNLAYKYATLPPDNFEAPNTYPPVYKSFVSLSLGQFLYFIVPDLVSDPVCFLSLFEEKFGKVADHLPLMAHHIILVKQTALKNISLAGGANPVHNSHSNNFSQRLYDTYCALEKNTSLRLIFSDFFKFYTSINLYSLDTKEYNWCPPVGYKLKDLKLVLDIFNNQLELTKLDRMETVCRFYVNQEQTNALVSDQKIYRFTRIKDITERKTFLYKALKLLGKIPPLDALCALSLSKKASTLQGKARAESNVVPNDVSLENGLIFKLFTSSLSIAPSVDESIAIFFPSVFL